MQLARRRYESVGGTKRKILPHPILKENKTPSETALPTFAL